MNKVGENRKINVLIACGDSMRREEIYSMLIKEKSIGAIRTTDNGKSSLMEIKKGIYDVAVIYSGINGNDGLWVLEQIRELKKKCRIIFVNDMQNKLLMDIVCSMSVDYIISEPFDTEILKNRIKQICIDSKEGLTQRTTVTEVINGLGICPGLKGYSYIKYAVDYILKKPDMIFGITKVVYPQIAVEFKTQPKCVERNIRHSIDISWNNSKEQYKNIFGFDFHKKPTNKQLICTLAEYIKERG